MVRLAQRLTFLAVLVGGIVAAQGNTCNARSASDWHNDGCIFSNPTATTVSDLGAHNRVVPSTSCEVTCPVNGGDFVVTSASGLTVLTQSEKSNAKALWLSNQASAIATYGHITWWDTSQITDFASMFAGSNWASFNEDITHWDVSNGQQFQYMFYQASSFNQNIEAWDVSAGINFSYMFYSASSFNQVLCWTYSPTSNGGQPNFHLMFTGSSGSNDPTQSDCPNYTSAPTASPTMSGTCNARTASDWYNDGCIFSNPTATTVFDLGAHNRVVKTTSCEVSCPVDGGDFVVFSATGLVDLSTAASNTWTYLKDTAVTAWMADPTTAAATYGHISWWDVGHEDRLENVFSANHNSVASFDEDISHWDVSGCTKFTGMFYGAAAFNQPIGGWDVSNGINFNNMFRDASAFDQQLSAWDISSGANFQYMFYIASSFSQYLCWTLPAGVTGTYSSYMFNGAAGGSLACPPPSSAPTANPVMAPTPAPTAEPTVVPSPSPTASFSPTAAPVLAGSTTMDQILGLDFPIFFAVVAAVVVLSCCCFFFVCLKKKKKKDDDKKVEASSVSRDRELEMGKGKV